LKGHTARHREFKLCAARGAPKNVKPGSHAICPLTHSREPPVSLAACSQYVWVDAAAIVTRQEAKIT
jgi:hypothetical protein